MSVIEEKKALRTFIRKKERTLDPVYKAESSEAICRHLLALDEYKSAKIVFAFAGTEKEIDTSLFMNETIAAYDRAGRRLGRGGGYYDRLLPQLHCPTVLICREQLMSPEVPVEEHDMRCTMLVTEKGVLTPEA